MRLENVVVASWRFPDKAEYGSEVQFGYLDGDFLSGITSQRRASSLVLAVIDLTDTACRELLASKEIQKVSFGKTC